MGKIREGIAGILYPPGTTRLELKVSCALVLILFSTQLTLTTPFPYLPSMVKSFGFNDADTGYYAGIIASSLFVGRFIGGYFWGYMTDKLGRRPVLLLSAILTYFATLLFGFSTNIYFAIAARFLQGLFNGVIVCGRAAFAEICDDTNQAIGVSLIFAAWNAAIVLGPAMGGFLANPVLKYPKVFGKGVLGKIFTKFRYLLPSIVITSLLLISIIATYCFFEETLEIKKKRPEKAKDEKEELELSYYEVKDDTPLLQDENQDEYKVKKVKRKLKHDALSDSEDEISHLEDDEKRARQESKFLCWGMVMRKVRKTSLYGLMSDPTVTICVVLFGLSGFVIIGFQELTALWMASKIKHGGLAFTTDKIGMSLLWPALASSVLQPILFGRVERRLGGILTLQICLIILSFTTAGFSFLNATQDNRALLWSLLIIIRLFRMLSDISVRSALAMFVNNSVYSDQAGVVNGYAFSVQEIMRAFSPSLLGALFAWSVKYGIHEIGFPMDHHIAFFTLTVVIIIEFAGSFLLPRSINHPKKRTTTKTLREAILSDSD